MDATTIPPGFVLLRRAQPGFVETCATIYINKERGVLAARVADIHLNPLGIAHGGFIATLADTAFGITLHNLRTEDGRTMVTAHLSVDYFSPAREGTWIEARPTVERSGRRLSHFSCRIVEGERLIASARAIFIAG